MTDVAFRTIRVEVEVEVVDGEWPGDDEACWAFLGNITVSVIHAGDSLLLVGKMTAEVLQ